MTYSGEQATVNFSIYKPHPGDGHGYSHKEWLDKLAKGGFTLSCQADPIPTSDAALKGYQCETNLPDGRSFASVSLIGAATVAWSTVTVSSGEVNKRSALALRTARVASLAILSA